MTPTTGDPMTTLDCPRCPTRWHQSGNRTGHCSGCHRTFSGIATFDAHQRIRGGLVCLDPAGLATKDGEPRFKTFTDSAGATVWRSAEELPPGTWDRAPRSDSTEDAGKAEQGLPGVPVHPTPLQAVTDGFSQTEETR